MRICRTIFALLVALSAATLPAAAGVAMIATAADAPMSVPSGFMSSGFMSEPTAQPMADRDHRAMPCHKGMNDCRSIDACAVKCFNFPGASVSVLPFPIVLTDGGPMLAVSGFRPQASRAPFRPPRI